MSPPRAAAHLLRLPESLGYSFRPLLRERGRRGAPSLPWSQCAQKILGRSLLNSAPIHDVYRRAILPTLCLHYGMASSSQLTEPTDTARQFATTHWSVVLTAGAGSSPAAQAALETLCRTYRYPLRSEEHTSELQSQSNLVCRLLL